MRAHRPARTVLAIVVALATIAAGSARVAAQTADRFLGREEIHLLGLGLRVEPAKQTVPKDISTIVSTFLQMPPSQQGSGVSPFAPGTILKATLRGPSLTAPLELTAQPNSPFVIPPLSVPGTHTLDEIRLEVDGQVLMRGTPESVTIEVIEKLLVTQVTTRPLTAQEIREKGIVFDKSSFQAYNFTAAFAVQDHPVQISFPVVLPSVQSGTEVAANSPELPTIAPPQAPKLSTIIPDTLSIQTKVPNLSVVGFTLKFNEQRSGVLVAPPIPGVVVIPGQIGFLNQFFSVLLMVGNAAPNGSNLVVTDLRGEIALPAGPSGVVGADDAPLRMATTASGPSPGVQAVVQPGPDGKTGTADDITSLAPGQTGSAEYLVEGRREGTHTIEFQITGTLNGLPGGPITVTGRAAGSVLVRNPSFTLTFTHPDTVAVGEPYTLDVTITNTSPSIANFVGVTLSPQNVSGATIVGDATQTVETIASGDSATVSFPLISQVAGRVFAATLDSDQNVQGRFALKAGVGELGVPVSPDSLVLPAQANSLPPELRSAALGLLGKAWSVATAPFAALPPDVTRFSKKIVYDRAIEVAEAGFRYSLHEPLDASVTHLLFDFDGNNYDRLASRTSSPSDLQFAQDDYKAFDELRRKSLRGDAFAAAVGAVLSPGLQSAGAAAFHQSLAERVSWRAPHLSVVASTGAGVLPIRLRLVDPQGRATGGLTPAGRITRDIPFSDLVEFADAGGAVTGDLALIASLPAGEYHVVLDPRDGASTDTPFTLSVVYPDANGVLQQAVFGNLTAASLPSLTFDPAAPWRVVFQSGASAPVPAAGSGPVAIAEPGPALIGVVQQAEADIVSVPTGADPLPVAAGRVIAALFNKEMTPESVQDGAAAYEITRYQLEDNAVRAVALQPGRRIVYLALRDPIGPLVQRTITLNGMTDAHGAQVAGDAVPIEATVGLPGKTPAWLLLNGGGVVSGRVQQADGSAILGAEVRLQYVGASPVLVSARPVHDDGTYSFDWVVGLPPGFYDRVTGYDPGTGDTRKVDFSLQRDGQRLNVNVVFLGRGTFIGRALAEDGTPLDKAQVRVTSLTDMSQYGATSADDGTFTVGRVPVGNVMIEAVHVASNSRVTISDRIPFAGATVTRDLVLLKEEVTKVTIKNGRLDGHVLLADGTSGVGGVSVVVYYQNGSQPGVPCPSVPGFPAPPECPVAVTNTAADGAFSFASVVAGSLRVESFNAATFQQGEARVQLPADGAVTFNLLLAQGLGTVKGLVLDSAGQPVGGASVGGGLSLTTTGGDGRFVLTDVPVGTRTLVAVSEALHSQASADVTILRAGQEVNVTIVLAGAGTIAGRVLEADGVTPVAGITVYVFYEDACDPPLTGICVRIPGTAVTDAQGRYSVPNLQLRDGYRVSAFRPDFSDGNVRPAPLQFANQVFRGDVVFRGGGGRVVGTVMNADGTAPLRASVGISGDRVKIAGGVVGTAFEHVENFQIADTDLATGTFAFTDVFVGPFTVSAVGAFSPDPITVEDVMPSAGATVRKDLRLTATSRITGTVFQPDGVTPVAANVVVRFKSEAFRTICTQEGSHSTCVDIPQGIQEENAVTGADGRYEIPLVNAGRFTLTAEDPVTGLTGQVRAQVAPGQTGDVPIRLLAAATVTVNVLGSDTRTPIPGARVVISQTGYPKKSLTRTADAQGVVVLSGGDAFSEGELVVIATDVRNGFSGRATGQVTRTGGALAVRVYLYDASGSVTGTVYRQDGVTPVENADVVIANARGALAFVQTDANGLYRADTIPLGPFSVDVFDPATARLGFATGHVDLDKQEVLVNVVQAAVGQVTGHVLSAASLAPLKLFSVQLFQTAPSGRFLPALVATSSVDGSFAFPGVTQGDFTLYASRVTADGFLSGSARGAIAGEGTLIDEPLLVVVPTNQTGRLEGEVINPDGSPAPNAQVRICTTGCNTAVAGYREFNVTAASDGTFAVDGVPVTRLEIQARSPVTQDAATERAQLSFDGETARVTITLGGLGTINGTARFADGAVAPNVRLEMWGTPSSGCAETCIAFADASGHFSFIDVTARTFTISAKDPVSGLQGSLGDVLNPGETKEVTVVLQAGSQLTGRVLTAAGNAAPDIVVELQSGLFAGNGKVFAVTDAAGTFTFNALKPGTYVLFAYDPLGTGVAKRILQVAGSDLALDDTVLDEAGPSVSAIAPPAGSVAVPLTQAVSVVFSEPLDPATVSAASVVLSGPAGVLPTSLALSQNDTVLTITPLAPLAEATLYAVQLSGVQDRVGKPLAPASVTSTFSTVDLTPPRTLDVTPPAGATGVSINTTVRLSFSEPVSPARFRGPPIVLTKAGAPVDGRLDYILGNTAIVFTPARPLELGTSYNVVTQPASDVVGNAQAQGLAFSFTTSDLTPPRVLALTPSSASVVEGTSVTVTADVGTADIAVVDFYVNDALALAARTKPFVLKLLATSAAGKPGESIKVSAIATDTSGLRGTVPAVTYVSVTADQPPAATITAPADQITVRNGDRVTVTVRGTDDLGIAQVAYRASTGQPQDAASRAVSPPARDQVETFGFNVPAGFPPGATIEVSATVVDTKGQQVTAAPVHLVVADATPPTVSITGTASGTRVKPGSDVVAVVSASDIGGIASVQFRATGVATYDETRAVSPAVPTVAASFTFHVPSTAGPTDTIRLEATAFDAAGNSAAAAPVVLSVADLNPPRVSLATTSGTTDAPIGSTVGIVVSAEDETGVARIDVSMSGAFSASDGRSVSPPLGSAAETFQVAVPAGAHVGEQVTVQATARDVFGNVSAPVSIVLTLRSVSDVTLPPSVVVRAGETVQVPVTLAAPAPAGGLRIDLASAAAGVATVGSPVTFGAGETSKTANVTGVTGGTTSVVASISGVPRTSMTVAVQGGVVSGIVYDPQLQPVSGAEVSVTDGANIQSTTTDGSGHYEVVGVGQSSYQTITVRAIDPVTKLAGVSKASLSAPNGFASVSVVLLSAGSIAGTVRRADGQTLAGAGARVDLFEPGGTSPIATAFTDDKSAYAFDLVSLGSYVLEASDAGGNRGRANATLDQSGQQKTVAIVYLGRGSVAGTVRDGAGAGVAGAKLRFYSTSVFGDAPVRETNAAADGTFRFDNVFVGSFTVQATDAVSNLAGTASGSVTQDGQVVPADVTLRSWGSVHGVVYRADAVTTVANTRVYLTTGSSSFFTLTDTQGAFSFTFVPLGTFYLNVQDLPTRGLGRATGVIASQGQDVTANVVMLGQGTVVATVVDATNTPVPGASVTYSPADSALQTAATVFTVTADGNGVAQLDNALAGDFKLTASSGPLSGTATGTLAAGAVTRVTVPLEATATLSGTVYLPDGVTPAQGATVSVESQGTPYILRSVVTGTDGTYRFDGLPARSYLLRVTDAGTLLRLQQSLQLQAGTTTQNLVFTAMGHVTGRVINPDGSSASNMGVTLQSANLVLGGYRFATTNAGGFYDFPSVPAGAFVVTTSDTGAGLLGEVTGSVQAEGQVLTLDIQLVANAIRFPVTKNDANGFTFDVQKDGTLAYGSNYVFGGGYTVTGGAFLLDIVSGGVATRFVGADIGRTELKGRQLVTTQNGIVGLSVTRKVFVPQSHFARYLEILSNPTASPITVDVRVQHLVTTTSGYPMTTVATSSGDAQLDVSDAANPDRWVTTAMGPEGDPFQNGSYPALAWTFDGPSARLRVSAASSAPRTEFGRQLGGRVAYEWDNVTIPPGGTVAFMHFGVQQMSRDAARASVDRLVQLAPEVIEGLSPAEIAAIQNFAVPDTGLSTVPPLPPLTGVVTGHVYEGDGVTPVPYGVVRFRSAVPVFARTYQASTDQNGAYRLAAGTATYNYSTVTVPVDAFTISGTHPVSYEDGPTTTFGFPAGQTTVTADYVFNTMGLLRGRILRADGTVVAAYGNSAYVNRTQPANPSVAVSAPQPPADGSFMVPGLPPGTYQVTVGARHPQGADLQGTATATVVARQVTTLDVRLPQGGSLTGVLRDARGAVVPSQYVTLQDAGVPAWSWNARTDASGVFTFVDVPAGAMVLEAYSPDTGLGTKIPTTIVAGQTVTQDIAYIATGTVTGHLLDRTGAPMPNFQVNITAPQNYGAGATTDANGAFTFTTVPAGVFALTAYDYTNRLDAEVDGLITTDGQTVDVDLRFQGVSLPATLTDANGSQYQVDRFGNLTGPANAYTSAYELSVITKDQNGNDQSWGFPGRNSALTELSDRQLVIRQSLANLYTPVLMTRKVFVPATGDYARYLDILENLGTTPATFDVQITSTLVNLGVLATSSGDQVFGPEDLWFITGAQGSPPVLSHVFAGPGAAAVPAVAQIGPLYCSFYQGCTYGATYRWNGLTLQPGQRLILMQFAVQESDPIKAQAAVDRLEQLPQDALAGLTAEDKARVVNFQVP